MLKLYIMLLLLMAMLQLINAALADDGAALIVAPDAGAVHNAAPADGSAAANAAPAYDGAALNGSPDAGVVHNIMLLKLIIIIPKYSTCVAIATNKTMEVGLNESGNVTFVAKFRP